MEERDNDDIENDDPSKKRGLLRLIGRRRDILGVRIHPTMSFPTGIKSLQNVLCKSGMLTPTSLPGFSLKSYALISYFESLNVIFSEKGREYPF